MSFTFTVVSGETTNTVQISGFSSPGSYSVVFAGSANISENAVVSGALTSIVVSSSFVTGEYNVTIRNQMSQVVFTGSSGTLTFSGGGDGGDGNGFTLSYDLNGGSGMLPDPITIAAGATSILLDGGAGLTKENTQFSGWSTDRFALLGTNYVSGPFTANVTVYAVWGTIPNQDQNAACFLGNAPVLTPAGWARIDSLSVGDLVRTADGRDVAIQRVKHQRIEAPSAAINPYVIPAGVWGATENLPISPRHCVAVPGRGMVEARELGLKQMPMRAAFDYFNLELPEWDNMVVAGVEVESLAPKKRVVMSMAELGRLVAALPAEKRAGVARFVTAMADGKVAVEMSRKERRMR
jgi:hypothetical protein